jgi:putative ABC transport system permease protein
VTVGLTPERIRAVQALEHVRSVDTFLTQEARVFLGGRAENILTYASPPEDAAFRKRLIAGKYLPPGGGRCAVVSEVLLYKLGVVDDAALLRIPGTKLRLENRAAPDAAPRALLSGLLGHANPATVGEEMALEKLLKRLPDALDKLDLTDAEKAAARQLFRPPSRPADKEVVVAEELTICGVLRPPEERDVHARWGWVHREVDVLLPPGTAEELYYRNPRNRKEGLQYVVVEVDAMDNVKEVSRKIRAMGLRTHALADLIEREQFTYRLIFSAMTVIAVVALLVAALGICNTMLMGVLERVREIGVMKAVGARDGHIQMIFLVEGALVGLVGGLLGLLLGWAASFPADAWVRATVESGLSVRLDQSVFAFPWWLLAGVPLFACLITTLAAFYPARRASRVNPVTALRHD